MSSRYRVDYHLKEHRRDELITWIKTLVSTPFVLNTIETPGSFDTIKRYAEIFRDVELLIEDHIKHTQLGKPHSSQLSKLVPSVGAFFTELPLVDAFYKQDTRRAISKRKFVGPSFNDIRQILNSAQIMALTNKASAECDLLKLITFDGDITLYEDGENFESDSPILPHLIELLKMDIVIGIVTAAGYKEADKYYERLSGLIDCIRDSPLLTLKQKENLIVMGGESNFLFRYNNEIKGLKYQEPDEWFLDEMKLWNNEDIQSILSYGEQLLQEFTEKLNVDDQTLIVVKERAVGVIPKDGCRLEREILEEIVLRVDKELREKFHKCKVNWCAFNGGRDVWIDIGDKSLGVRVLQQVVNLDNNKGSFVTTSNTLHVGDQFASLGNNDYASRTAAATAWVAGPWETELLLKDIVGYAKERFM